MRLRKALPGAPEVVFRGRLPDGAEAESLDPQCHPFGAAVDEQHSKARSDELDQLFKAPELFLVPCHEQLLTQPVGYQTGRDFLPCQQPVQIRGCPQDQGLVVHQPFKHHKGQLVALHLQTVDLQIRRLSGELCQPCQGILQRGTQRLIQSRVPLRNLISMPLFPLQFIKQQNRFPPFL